MTKNMTKTKTRTKTRAAMLALWLAGTSFTGAIGCASTQPQPGQITRKVEKRGVIFDPKRAPQAVAAGAGILHAYSRGPGATILIVASSGGDPARTCANAQPAGRNTAIPADGSIEVAIGEEELACLLPGRDELLWHTHALPPEPRVVLVEKR